MVVCVAVAGEVWVPLDTPEMAAAAFTLSYKYSILTMH